jgi:hypothetical protein
MPATGYSWIDQKNRLQLKRERLASTLAYVSSTPRGGAENGHRRNRELGARSWPRSSPRRSDVDAYRCRRGGGRKGFARVRRVPRPPSAKLAVSITVALCKSDCPMEGVVLLPYCTVQKATIVHGRFFFWKGTWKFKLGQRRRDGHYTTSHSTRSTFLATCRVGSWTYHSWTQNCILACVHFTCKPKIFSFPSITSNL